MTQLHQGSLFAAPSETKSEESTEQTPRPLNRYEQRQEERRERLLDRADKARRDSGAAYQRSRDILDPIPLGQPILVGHHSESRHQNDLKRADNAMRKSVEAQKQADRLEERAHSVGKGGISADDPEAIAKLRTKLEQHERLQADMKAINAAYRKGGWDEVERRGLMSHEGRVKGEAAMAKDWMPVAKRRPFVSWQLSNNNAEISRIKKRIAALEAQADTTDSRTEHDGFTLAVETDDNRVRFYFDGKPAEAVRTILKRYGFRWSRNAGAWQRQATQNGIATADYIVPQIKDALQAA